MPKLDMDGPFDLKDKIVDKKISATAIGNFALGYLNAKGKFAVKVVGRSDKDLNGEIKSARRRFSGGLISKMFGRNKLKKFKYSIADDAQTAYQVEQRAFDNFGGQKSLLNSEMPAPPQ